jgi:hypothetical protein
VWNLASGSLSRASLGENGRDPNGASTSPSVSNDGDSVAFVSSASNLDTSFADNNDKPDLHVARLGPNPQIARLSLSDVGGESEQPMAAPVISGDGRHVAFETAAAQLAPGSVLNQLGVYVRTNPLVGTAARDRSGIWWRASESGWGLFTFDQGSAIALGWFTYDVDGEPTWYSGAALPQTDGSYRGQVNRVTGVPFDQITGIAAEVVTTFADVSLRFSGPDGLQFDYQIVGGPAQGKSLVRFPFGARETRCRPGTAAERLASSNYSDVWWGGAQTSGWGLFITQVDDRIFPMWFTYDNDREGVYFSGNGTRQGAGSFSGQLFRSRDGTPAAQINDAPPSSGSDAVGTFQIVPINGSSADFRYNVNGIIQSKPIERLVVGTAPPVCETVTLAAPQ